MTGIRMYLKTCCAAVLLVSFCTALVPEGKGKQAVSLIGGLVILLVVMTPLLGLKPDHFTDDLSVFGEFPLITEATDTAERELEVRIREDCESYILDKAVSMGMDIRVEVFLNTESALPYPASAVIEGNVQDPDRLVLSQVLADELGIPMEKQEWNTD